MRRQVGYLIVGLGSVIRDFGLRLAPPSPHPAEQSNAELEATWDDYAGGGLG